MKLCQLEWFELQMAITVGVHRYVESLRNHHRNLRQSDEDDLLINVIGACGEAAAAKACGVYWDGSINVPAHRGDIGPGWQVRTAYKTPPGRLCIRPRDRADAIFILVFATKLWQLHVHGWITADEARRIGKVEGYNGLEAACFVEPPALHPISDLVTPW